MKHFAKRFAKCSIADVWHGWFEPFSAAYVWHSNLLKLNKELELLLTIGKANKGQSRHHIETKQLIFTLNQLTGFYLISDSFYLTSSSLDFGTKLKTRKIVTIHEDFELY